MKYKIELTKNQFAIVDKEDFEKFNKFNWQAYKLGREGQFYAGRSVRIGLRKFNKKKMLYLHREIMQASENEVVDHINGNPLDNRKQNLRICSQRNNVRYQRPKLNKYKGVRKQKGSKTWFAEIKYNGKLIRTKGFKSEKQAALAYNEMALNYFKEFAKLNIIKEK